MCSAEPRACTRTASTRPSPSQPKRPHASRLRTQQAIAFETGVANVSDPLGGSWFVEALTDEVERQAEEILLHVQEAGLGFDARRHHRPDRVGLVPGRDRRVRLPVGEEAQQRPPHRRRRERVHRGQRRGPASATQIGPEVEERQRKRLDHVKRGRTTNAVAAALAQAAGAAAEPTTNVMPGAHRRREGARHRRRDRQHARRRLRPLGRKPAF